MRKVFSNGFFVFAGIVSLPVTVTHLGPQLTPAAEYRDDPRVEALQRFFERSNCPAAQLAQAFLDAADQHDLDWRLLPSISYVESSGGKAAPHNNLFGWDSGKAEFATMTDAISQVAFRLANSALYRDKDTDGILATYNPNSEYADRVKSVMERIAPAE